MKTARKYHDLSPENFDLLIKENIELKTALESAERKLNYFIEQAKLAQMRKFGKKTENANQLELDFSQAFDEGELTEEAQEIPEEPESITVPAHIRKKKSVGRKIDTTNLPREQIIHDLSEEEKICKCCSEQLTKFGEDKSEQLEYIPAQIKVIEHVCNKYICKHCEIIKSATKPEMPIAKSMAAPSLITEVIIRKFEHHLPWYRQSKIFMQDGINIPANTICNWYLQAGEILKPLQEAARLQLTQVKALQADETTVKILKDDIKGYMWAYHSCEPKNRFIIFEYNDTRAGEVVNNTLENYQGILQTDGYSGYNAMRNKKGVINLGCWAHCRRKFAEVVKISTTAGKAHEVVKWIGKLYAVEDEAREQKLSFAARKNLRQLKSVPILEKLNKVIVQSTTLSQSALGKAITYATNQWEYLTKYVNYGEAEIDNNWCENQIRPFALGRKNWLFIGNKDSAQVAAFFYGIIQTCRLNNIDPRKYIIYALANAGKIRRQELDATSLLPQFIDRTLLE